MRDYYNNYLYIIQMKKILILLCFNLSAQLPGFMQEDKFKHEQAGMLIGGLASSSYYFFIPNKAMAFLVGNGVATTAGVGKEFYDKYSGKGVPSFWDGFATYFGGKRITLMFIIGANENEKKLARLEKINKFAI